MSVQGARAVAYDVLRAVSADEAYANLSLPHAIEPVAPASTPASSATPVRNEPGMARPTRIDTRAASRSCAF